MNRVKLEKTETESIEIGRLRQIELQTRPRDKWEISFLKFNRRKFSKREGERNREMYVYAILQCLVNIYRVSDTVCRETQLAQKRL